MKKLFESYGFNDIDDYDSLETEVTDWEKAGFKLIATKPVLDTDGFQTELAWYEKDGLHYIILGDTELYNPCNESPITYDPLETQKEAKEWFDNYTGEDEEDDYHGFFSPSELDEKITLTESYDNLPSWIIDALEKNALLKKKLSQKGVNLKTAIFTEYPPGNITSRDLSDLGKVFFLDLSFPQRWGSGFQKVVYVPRFTDPEVNINDRYRRLSKVAAKTLAIFCNRCGYIDLEDSMNRNTELRNQRSMLKKQYVDRDLSKAQHPVRRNVVYAKKPDGYNDYDNVLSYDIEWITERGYDKSGYPINPDKYIKMLNDVGLHNYAERLDSIYQKIELCRSRILTLVNKFDILSSNDYVTTGFNRNVYSNIGDIIKQLADIIDSYLRLKQNIDRILNKDRGDMPKDESIRWEFKYDGSRISKDITQLLDDIRRLESAKLREEE